MHRALRISAVFAILVLPALSTFAQDRPLAGTVIDVDEGRGRLQIESDDDRSARTTIETDTVSTTYYGFGTVIAGKPEIFTGSAGFANIRLGDRIEVRGSSTSAGVTKASRITLLGRQVAASQVGVGNTRPPTSVATPTDDRSSGAATDANGAIEGTIRSMNQNTGRIVIQTADRRMVTIRTGRNTPVFYRGQSYRVSNLEVGDRIRVEAEPRDSQADEITARRIDVTLSVQDTPSTPSSGGLVTQLVGRVTRIESGLDYVYIDQGRGGETRVDMSQAEDARGDSIRARDIHISDRLEISGSFNKTGDMFLASTVRFASSDVEEEDVFDRGPVRDEGIGRYGVVTLSGTILETLEDGPTIAVRDRDTDTTVRVWITSSFIVRTKAGTYTTAENLRVNDIVVLDAFRDASGNLIAQTVRIRNR